MTLYYRFCYDCGKLKKKEKQAHYRTAILEFVKSMKVYTKNTKISMSVQGDGSELFEYALPFPNSYHRQNRNTYTISYIIKGNFTTKAGYEYVNDIMARFALSVPMTNMWLDYVNTPLTEAYDLKQFQGLKSIQKIKDYTKVTSGKDNTFWAIKLYTEELIKEGGEGNLVAHSLISSYAHRLFTNVEKSTLRAKVRSIWEWYDARGWTIPQRYERDRKTYYEDTKMTRTENMKKINADKAEKNYRAVANLLSGLFSTDYQKKNGKWHIGKIAVAVSMTEKTVSKYIKEYESK